MDIINICILLSSLSFFSYTAWYFVSPKMKGEFKRFGIEKLGLFIIITQFVGASGLMIGFIVPELLIISSLGLAIQMLAGVIVRIKIKDSIWVSLPAFFYMVLNAYIFLESIY